MLIWILAAIISLLLTAAMLLTLRGTSQSNSNATANDTATHDHFRKQLLELERDHEAGHLSPDAYEAAKAELARELVRVNNQAKSVDQAHSTHQATTSNKQKSTVRQISTIVMICAVPVSALLIYASIGQPNLPSAPLEMRTDLPEQMSIEQAVAQIEKRLAETPDDVRGWQALAPVLMRLERFDDAAFAFGRINELQPPTADSLTNQAEANLMANNGHADQNILALLQLASNLDPTHVRSRFYLAGELTRSQDWERAAALWQDLLALSDGSEPWVAMAQNGLALALGEGETDMDPRQGLTVEEGAELPTEADVGLQLSPEDLEMVEGMVASLQERLESEGGSAQEWAQLVRSFMVLGRTDAAQTTYQSAITIYPDGSERAILDDIAENMGLTDLSKSTNEGGDNFDS